MNRLSTRNRASTTACRNVRPTNICAHTQPSESEGRRCVRSFPRCIGQKSCVHWKIDIPLDCASLACGVAFRQLQLFKSCFEITCQDLHECPRPRPLPLKRLWGGLGATFEQRVCDGGCRKGRWRSGWGSLGSWWLMWSGARLRRVLPSMSALCGRWGWPVKCGRWRIPTGMRKARLWSGLAAQGGRDDLAG